MELREILAVLRTAAQKFVWVEEQRSLNSTEVPKAIFESSDEDPTDKWYSFKLRIHEDTDYDPKHLLSKKYAAELGFAFKDYGSGVKYVYPDWSISNLLKLKHHGTGVSGLHNGIYTLDGKNWYAPKYVLPKFLRISDVVVSTSYELPAHWQDAIEQHYGHGGGQHDPLQKIGAELISYRDEYSDLLAVPAKYKKAWRLMAAIKPADMQKFCKTSLKKLGEQGSFKGGVYQPRKLISSWSVDLVALEKEHHHILGDALEEQEEPGTFSVIIETDLGKTRDKFIFNPDKLPQFLKRQQVIKEREIISVGKIPLSRISYHLVSKDYDDSVEKFLTEMLDKSKKAA